MFIFWDNYLECGYSRWQKVNVKHIFVHFFYILYFPNLTRPCREVFGNDQIHITPDKRWTYLRLPYASLFILNFQTNLIFTAWGAKHKHQHCTPSISFTIC